MSQLNGEVWGLLMVQPPPPKCSMEPSRELDADVTSLGAGGAVRCQNPREQVLTRRPQSRGSRCPCSRCGQRDKGASVPPAPQGPVGTASTWPSSALRRGWRIGSWRCLVDAGTHGVGVHLGCRARPRLRPPVPLLRAGRTPTGSRGQLTFCHAGPGAGALTPRVFPIEQSS